MSPNAPIQVVITSRPPSREALHLELQYPTSATSTSSSECTSSPPPDSPSDFGHPPLHRQHATGQHSSGTSSHSPSPTNSEFPPQHDHGRRPQANVHTHTVPVIPTLIPMPCLTAESSGPNTPSDVSTSVHIDSQAGPSRTHSKPSSAPFGLSAAMDQSTPYDPSHPYARIYTRKEGAKRRKMWNHAHEKALFTPQEISTMGAPQRRTIYTASLEAHIDKLHAQLLSYALFPVPFEKLDCFRGLNTKTAKSMVAGLHRDANELRMKRLELERAMYELRGQLYAAPSVAPTYAHPQMHHATVGVRRYSLD